MGPARCSWEDSEVGERNRPFPQPVYAISDGARYQTIRQGVRLEPTPNNRLHFLSPGINQRVETHG